MDLPSRYTDTQIGLLFLQRYICVHLDSDRDKFNLIILMSGPTHIRPLP